MKKTFKDVVTAGNLLFAINAYKSDRHRELVSTAGTTTNVDNTS